MRHLNNGFRVALTFVILGFGISAARADTITVAVLPGFTVISPIPGAGGSYSRVVLIPEGQLVGATVMGSFGTPELANTSGVNLLVGHNPVTGTGFDVLVAQCLPGAACATLGSPTPFFYTFAQHELSNFVIPNPPPGFSFIAVPVSFLSLGGGSILNISELTFTFTTTPNATTVSEPSTLLLLGTGLTGVVAIFRGRRKSGSAKAT